MAERFHLEIVTPDRQFFIGEAESLVLPAVDGQLGVLKGHSPVVTALEPGMLQFRTAEGEETAVVGQGLAEIFPERVMVLASFASFIFKGLSGFFSCSSKASTKACIPIISNFFFVSSLIIVFSSIIICTSHISTIINLFI